MKRVGIQRLNYPERINIFSLNVGRVQFEIVGDDWAQFDQSLRTERESNWSLRDFSCCPVNVDVDCFHYFNSIPINNVPFVSSFESALPRWFGASPEFLSIGISTLQSQQCRRLFALCKNAVEINREHLKRLKCDGVDRILDKVEVVYPPQTLYSVEEEKFSSSTLKIAFVASDFLRKGGVELVRAVEQLVHEGFDIHLHVASSMRILQENRPWNIDAQEKINRSLSVMAAHPDHFSFQGFLSHGEVIDLYRASHVAALPSFHDTFGFSVLEAQAACCPVLTTNQRSFPEINTPEIGFVALLPVDALNQPNFNPASFDELSNTLCRGVVDALLDAYSLRGRGLRDKARLARKRIKEMHDPTQIGDQVYSWY